MLLSGLLTLLLLSLSSAATIPTTYHGFQVVGVRLERADQVELVQDLMHMLNLNVLVEPRVLGHDVDVLVPPAFTPRLMRGLIRRGIHSHVKIHDVQQVIDEQERARSLKGKQGLSRAFDHTDYHNLDEINAILDQAVADFPSLMSMYTAGTTYEGRPIRVAQVSTDGGSSGKNVIWIDCGIHAREWVSPATCQYIVDQLTSGYGADSEVSALLNTYDFHIMTNTNPDGYDFTWTNDRMWRKNRVPYDLCFGTDPNRNFDSNFGGPGTSDSPCMDTYHGPSAFSEAETQAVRDALLTLGNRVSMYISIHSYSQYWMTPYGYTYSLPANYNEQKRVADIGVAALQAVYGTQFVSGNIADVIYLASGGSCDWVYDSAGVQYNFALELRDEGQYGFLLPADQILPTADESWTGIKAAINAI